jgi:hypothetical protein
LRSGPSVTGGGKQVCLWDSQGELRWKTDADVVSGKPLREWEGPPVSALRITAGLLLLGLDDGSLQRIAV